MEVLKISLNKKRPRMHICFSTSLDFNREQVVLLKYKYDSATSGYLFSTVCGNDRLFGLSRPVSVLLRCKNDLELKRTVKVLREIHKHDASMVKRIGKDFWNFLSCYMGQRRIKMTVLGRRLKKYENIDQRR